jgi:uncharacterized protein YggE
MRIPRPLAAAALAAATPLAAAEPVPTLTVTAEASVDAAPDVANVSAGVVTQAPDAAAALAANSARMKEVVQALRSAGVEARDIQTSQLGLQPQYRYREGQAPLITGYQATNSVSVRLRDLARIGPVLDTLVKVGANSISGPSFMIDRPEPLLDRARSEAVKAARARADLIASAAGVEVVRVLSIREGAAFDPEPRPMMRAMAMESAPAPAPPVEAGETRLRAQVTVTFEIR